MPNHLHKLDARPFCRCLMSLALLVLMLSDTTRADFVWGTSTAAYQVEGSRAVDGRQPSVWDAFDTSGLSRRVRAVKPGGASNVYRNESGAVADDDYARYLDSATLTRQLGANAARISVSWSRIMTYKRDSAPPTKALAWDRNELGIAHYRRLLKAYAAKGVRVALTFFHWDTPLLLEEHAVEGVCYNASAWLCPWMKDAFVQYASLLIAEFGRPEYNVGWWLTLNEPLTVAGNGYGKRIVLPVRPRHIVSALSSLTTSTHTPPSFSLTTWPLHWCCCYSHTSYTHIP